jgi:hypothetical protein
MKNPKLAELDQAFATLKKDFDSIKTEVSASSPGEEMCSKNDMYGMLDRIMGSVYNMVDNLHARINEVDDYHWKTMGEHKEGHLPPYKTASQLQAFLKTCGMDKDYDVIKPAIFASTNKGLTLNLDCSKVTMKK